MAIINPKPDSPPPERLEATPSPSLAEKRSVKRSLGLTRPLTGATKRAKNKRGMPISKLAGFGAGALTTGAGKAYKGAVDLASQGIEAAADASQRFGQGYAQGRGEPGIFSRIKAEQEQRAAARKMAQPDASGKSNAFVPSLVNAKAEADRRENPPNVTPNNIQGGQSYSTLTEAKARLEQQAEAKRRMTQPDAYSGRPYPTLTETKARLEQSRTIDPQANTTRYDMPQGYMEFQGTPTGQDDRTKGNFSGQRTDADARRALVTNLGLRDESELTYDQYGNISNRANRMNAKADDMRTARLERSRLRRAARSAAKRDAMTELAMDKVKRANLDSDPETAAQRSMALMQSLPDQSAQERLANNQQVADREQVLLDQAASVQDRKLDIAQQQADTQRMQAQAQQSQNQQRQYRPLPQTSINTLNDSAKHLDNINRLMTNFNDDYFGTVFDAVGNAENALAKRGFGDEGQANWWQDYQGFTNLVRNELFGAALTATEKTEFNKANVTPGMDPKIARQNLLRQQQIATEAAQRLGRSMMANGADPNVIYQSFGDQSQSLFGHQGQAQNYQRINELGDQLAAQGMSREQIFELMLAEGF